MSVYDAFALFYKCCPTVFWVLFMSKVQVACSNRVSTSKGARGKYLTFFKKIFFKWLKRANKGQNPKNRYFILYCYCFNSICKLYISFYGTFNDRWESNATGKHSGQIVYVWEYSRWLASGTHQSSWRPLKNTFKLVRNSWNWSSRYIWI